MAHESLRMCTDQRGSVAGYQMLHTKSLRNTRMTHICRLSLYYVVGLCLLLSAIMS